MNDFAPVSIPPSGTARIGIDTRVDELLALPARDDPARRRLRLRQLPDRPLIDFIPDSEQLGEALAQAARTTTAAGASLATNTLAEQRLAAACEDLVVVIVSTYNSAGYVVETLESILRQDHSALLTIVVDDGSADGTAEIVRNFMNAHAEAMAIAFLVIPHMGNPGVTRNVGLHGLCPRHAKWIAFMDGDDTYACGSALATLVAALRGAEGRIAAFGDYDWIDARGRLLARPSGIRRRFGGSWDWRRGRRLDWRNIAVGQLVVFHLQCLLVVQGAPFLPYRPHGEDAEYYCFLFRWSARLHAGRLDGIVQVPALIAHYRKHDSSLTSRPVDTFWQEPPRSRSYAVADVPRFYDLAGIPDEHVTRANVSRWRARQFAREFNRAAFRGQFGRAGETLRDAWRRPSIRALDMLLLPLAELFGDPGARDALQRTLGRLVSRRGR